MNILILREPLHNSMARGETYHMPLRRVFRILHERHPNIQRAILLQYAVKSQNDTMGPNGLVPYLIIFRTIPSFPMTTIDVPAQKTYPSDVSCSR